MAGRSSFVVLLLLATSMRGAESQGADPNQLQIQVLDRPADCRLVSEVGDTLAVHYTGTLINGTVFDSSLNRGEPFEFKLGAREVIPGWDQGMEGMCVGEQRRLVVPSHLAYGDRGAGNVIPPGATLVFEVQLVGLPGKPLVSTQQEEILQRPNPSQPIQEKSSELQVQTLVNPNSCPVRAKTGDTVTVHYAGYFTNSLKFDSSLDRNEPFAFKLGSGQVIPGWEKGVVGMCVGERRRLEIPPNLAYGDRGVGDIIPPKSTLIFDVQLLDLSSRSP